MNKGSSWRRIVCLGLPVLAAVSAWTAPGTADPFPVRQETLLRRAVDSLAVMNGVDRDRFRVDPAALDFARSYAGEFKLQRYLVREPLRIPETMFGAANDLAKGSGLRDRIRLLTDLVGLERSRTPRTPVLGRDEIEKVLGSPQPLIDALEKVFEGTGKRFTGKDRDVAVRQVSTLSLPLRADVASLLLAVLEGAKARDRTVEASELESGGMFDRKSRKTADRLRSYLLQWDAEDAVFDPEVGKIWSALPTVDLGDLYAGGEDLAGGIDGAAAALAGDAPGVEPGHPTAFQYTWDTPLGSVSVGGTGANTYTGRYALVVDLGGDDRYLGPGSVSGQDPVSVVVDLDGDDLYAAADSSRCGPGGAILGYAGVVDRGTGRDTYRGPSWSCAFSFLGVGWIEDGGGDDVYETQWLGQGAALFGIALLLDEGGNDSFTIAVQDTAFPVGRSQGFGGPGGTGLILDLDGDDTYGLAEDFRDPGGEGRFAGFLQGTAGGFRDVNAGGIGLLVDAAGNDRYRAANLAQGTGVDAGVGVLIDGAGTDTYTAGSWVMGCGLRRGVGVLLEEDGDDMYEGRGRRGLGLGFDLGTGMLVDLSGKDGYSLRGQPSLAPGDLPEDPMLGFGSCRDQGAGWFLDLGGQDTYTPHGRELFARADSGPVSPWRATVPGVAVFVDLEQRAEGANPEVDSGSPWFPARGEGATLGGGVFGAVDNGTHGPGRGSP